VEQRRLAVLGGHPRQNDGPRAVSDCNRQSRSSARRLWRGRGRVHTRPSSAVSHESTPAVLRHTHQHTHAPRLPSFAPTASPSFCSCRRVAPARLPPNSTLGAHDLLGGRSVFDCSLRPALSAPHSSSAASPASPTHSSTPGHNIGRRLTDPTAWAHYERAAPGKQEHIASGSRRP